MYCLQIWLILGLYVGLNVRVRINVFFILFVGCFLVGLFVEREYKVVVCWYLSYCYIYILYCNFYINCGRNVQLYIRQVCFCSLQLNVQMFKDFIIYIFVGDLFNNVKV